MQQATLRSGKVISMDTWDFSQLEEFAAREQPKYNLGNVEIFQGFSFLGPGTPERIRISTSTPLYADEKNLSPLEIQEHLGLPNEAYHYSLAALSRKGILGLLACEWMKRGRHFWHYHIRFLDVRKDCQKQGVGSALVKALHSADFIDQKILDVGLYTDEGRFYIRPVIERELTGDRYALIPDNYGWMSPPRECGVYDHAARKINPLLLTPSCSGRSRSCWDRW